MLQDEDDPIEIIDLNVNSTNQLVEEINNQDGEAYIYRVNYFKKVNFSKQTFDKTSCHFSLFRIRLEEQKSYLG